MVTTAQKPVEQLLDDQQACQTMIITRSGISLSISLCISQKGHIQQLLPARTHGRGAVGGGGGAVKN